MQPILQIIERAGGGNPGLFPQNRKRPLHGPCPGSHRSRSVRPADHFCHHYWEQNGDLMRDPERCFELLDGELDSYYILPCRSESLFKTLKKSPL